MTESPEIYRLRDVIEPDQIVLIEEMEAPFQALGINFPPNVVEYATHAMLGQTTSLETVVFMDGPDSIGCLVVHPDGDTQFVPDPAYVHTLQLSPEEKVHLQIDQRQGELIEAMNRSDDSELLDPRNQLENALRDQFLNKRVRASIEGLHAEGVVRNITLKWEPVNIRVAGLFGNPAGENSLGIRLVSIIFHGEEGEELVNAGLHGFNARRIKVME
jgi:hypothetical protein